MEEVKMTSKISIQMKATATSIEYRELADQFTSTIGQILAAVAATMTGMQPFTPMTKACLSSAQPMGTTSRLSPLTASR